MPEEVPAAGAPGDLVLLLSTFPSQEAAEALVERLVGERLIACGNLLPGLRSVYRWQGEVAREAEVLAIMKTTRARVGELLRRAAELHPYEVPELVTISPEAVADAYARWVREETSEESE
jgi:periplasmic divalent cation tolerance protein